MIPLPMARVEKRAACETCRGACCEMFSIPLEDFRKLNYSEDAMQWLGVRGVEFEGSLLFEARCRMLTTDGRCSIYATRPQICRDWEENGADCRAVVRARRPGLIDA